MVNIKISSVNLEEWQDRYLLIVKQEMLLLQEVKITLDSLVDYREFMMHLHLFSHLDLLKLAEKMEENLDLTQLLLEEDLVPKHKVILLVMVIPCILMHRLVVTALLKQPERW